MKLWLVEMTFTAGGQRTYDIRYFIEMTDGYARRLRDHLERAKAVRADGLLSFDVEQVADLVYGLDEFVAEVNENHPGLLDKMGKRWGRGGP